MITWRDAKVKSRILKISLLPWWMHMDIIRYQGCRKCKHYRHCLVLEEQVHKSITSEHLLVNDLIQQLLALPLPNNLLLRAKELWHYQQPQLLLVSTQVSPTSLVMTWSKTLMLMKTHTMMKWTGWNKEWKGWRWTWTSWWISKYVWHSKDKWYILDKIELVSLMLMWSLKRFDL